MKEIRTKKYEKLKLTNLAHCYCWHNGIGEYGEYSFTDEDRINVEHHGRMKQMGIPDSERYTFSFWKTPEKAKRKVVVWIIFDNFGKYTKTKTHSSIATKKEIKQWESEAVSFLINDGWLE